MLIEAFEYKKCAPAAKNFMTYLFEQKDIFVSELENREKKTIAAMISKTAFTHCIMYMVKTNELAKEFVERDGFKIFKLFL
jgi:hypothetical protein